MVNIMAADDLATQGVRVLVVMLLPQVMLLPPEYLGPSTKRVYCTYASCALYSYTCLCLNLYYWVTYRTTRKAVLFNVMIICWFWNIYIYTCLANSFFGDTVTNITLSICSHLSVLGEIINMNLSGSFVCTFLLCMGCCKIEGHSYIFYWWC